MIPFTPRNLVLKLSHKCLALFSNNVLSKCKMPFLSASEKLKEATLQIAAGVNV